MNSCKNITDEALNTLGKELQRLENLKSLKLNLSGCNEITTKGLKNLREGLKKLHFLQNLKILPSAEDY